MRCVNTGRRGHARRDAGATVGSPLRTFIGNLARVPLRDAGTHSRGLHPWMRSNCFSSRESLSKKKAASTEEDWATQRELRSPKSHVRARHPLGPCIGARFCADAHPMPVVIGKKAWE